VNCYNSQDKKKGRLCYNTKYNAWSSPLLGIDDVLKLIDTDGLRCYYCENKVNILPSTKKDKNQFTLDRIDNEKSHAIQNCKICCLNCNDMRSNDYTSEEFKKIKSR